MARVIQFIDDFSFWSIQLAFVRRLSQRNPGLVLAHEAIQEIQRAIRLEQREYRKLYGEGFSMRNVDARTLIEWITQSGYKPNVWESGFMASLYEQGFAPTAKQKTCLNRIYEKASGGGVYERHERIG